MDVIRGAVSGADDASLDVAVAHQLLRRVGRGELGETLRVYRPRRPTVAFGRRDTLLPGFPVAARAARAAGFAPVIRAPGGRCVAYTERALVVDHVCPDPDAFTGMDDRFRRFGARWAELLGRHGIDARVGEVPGEYCPGSFSVNAGGRTKLVGTAQRVVRGGWLFSAVLIHDDADRLRPVLDEIYRGLGLPFEPTSVGSVRRERPDLPLAVLEDAVLAAYAGSDPRSDHPRSDDPPRDHRPRDHPLAPDLLAAAVAALPDHRA